MTNHMPQGRSLDLKFRTKERLDEYRFSEPFTTDRNHWYRSVHLESRLRMVDAAAGHRALHPDWAVDLRWLPPLFFA